MATQRYYAGVTTTHPGWVPPTFHGAWDDTASAVTRRLRTDKEGAQTSIAVAETSASNTWDVCCLRLVSEGLPAGTLSGTLQLCFGGRDGGTTMAASYHVYAWVTQGDTDTARGVLLNDYVEAAANEWTGTTGAVFQSLVSAQAISTVNVQPGDRIVVELGYRANNTTTSSQTGRIYYGGTGTDAAPGNTSTEAAWIDMDWAVGSPTAVAGKRYYFTREAAPISPTPAGAWDATTVTRGLLSAMKGALTASNVSQSETSATNNWDVLLTQHVSAALDTAQTISGTVDLCVAMAESSNAADDTIHVHIWVTQGDTSTPRGTLLADYIGINELPSEVSVTAGYQIPQQTLTSVAAQVGDRIVVEIGYRSQNTSATSFTGRVTHGGHNATDMSYGDYTVDDPGWVQFNNGISDAETRINWSDKWYLGASSEDSPVLPPVVQGSWDDTTSATTVADLLLNATPGAASSTIGLTAGATTQNRKKLLGRFVSRPLNAGTIPDSTFRITGLVLESNADADMVWCCHLFLMKPDGSTRTTLVNTVADPDADNEWPTGTRAGRQSDEVAIATTSITQDDRLVLEIGFKQLGAAIAANRTGTLTQGGTGADASNGDTDTTHPTWLGTPPTVNARRASPILIGF